MHYQTIAWQSKERSVGKGIYVHECIAISCCYAVHCSEVYVEPEASDGVNGDTHESVAHLYGGGSSLILQNPDKVKPGIL